MHFTWKNHKTYKYNNCTKQAPTKTPDVMWMLDDIGKDQYLEDACVCVCVCLSGSTQSSAACIKHMSIAAGQRSPNQPSIQRNTSPSVNNHLNYVDRP